MNVDPEAAVRETASGLALGPAVLSSDLLFVALESLVEPGIGHEILLRRRLLICGQKILVLVDPELAVFGLQQNPLAHRPVGHDVAVAVERELAVPVDLAENLERDVIVRGRKRPEARDLLSPTLVDRPVMGAVDSPVGRLVEPGENIRVGLPDRAVLIAPPEPLPQIIDRPFHFPLRPGAVGRAETRLEDIMMGEVEELGVEDGFAGLVAADDHVLHVVVEDLGGHALEITKTPDVAGHKALESRAFDELGIDGPAEAQDDHEDIDGGRPARRFFDLEVAPVELGLVTRLRLESGVGEARLALLDCPDVALHRVVAACITPVLESIHDPGRLVVILLQIVLDRLNMGREDRFPRLTLAVTRKLVAQEMLLDRLAMTTRLLGDRPDALAVPVHGHDFHKYLLGDHWVSPPFVEETIPWVQSPGGTLFVPIIGTLFHAHRQQLRGLVWSLT